MTAALPSTVIDAWQAALSAEQQAAFGYALLGPRLTTTQDQNLARSDQDAHESARDRTADAIAAAGTTPGAPEGDYPALYPAARVPQALAATLEDDCAAAWRYLYGVIAAASEATMHDATDLRTQAQQSLTASAVRATRWRLRAKSARPVTAFPGAS